MKLAVLLALAFAAPAWAEAPAHPDTVAVFETDMGYHFTNTDGRTLYVYDGDEVPLKSSCVGTCSKQWPPLAADDSAQAVGEWTPIARPDSGKQWAFRGKPVYAYALDPQKGARLGDGVLNVWHVAIALHPRPPGVKYYGTVKGRVAADPSGMTLYTRASGDCTGTCLNTWKPFAAPRAAVGQGDWSIVTRADDKTVQWAYRGKALYTYANDLRAGDTRGQGVDKAWQPVLVQPALALPKWVTVQNSDYGPLFADQKGLTLYSVPDLKRLEVEATCNAECLKANWIPMIVAADETPSGNWSTVALPDGSKQWTYRALPVFRFVGDKKPGDIFGDRFALGGGGTGWKIMTQATLREEPL